MESSEIEASSNIECRMNSSLYSVPNMPTTEQQESSFIVCDSRSSSSLANASAPLYSFDEDGDILPRVNNTFTPNNSVESDLDNTSLAYLDNEGRGIVSGGVANHKGKTKDTNRVNERGSASRTSTARQQKEEAKALTSSSSSPALSTSSSRRRKLGMIKSSSGGVSEGSTESGDPPAPPGPFPPQPSSEDKSNASSSTPEGMAPLPPLPPPQVNIVLENTSVPKIDFHAPSIEVVDDYLESNLDGNSDSQLKDLCSSLFGETGFPGHQIRSSTGSCVSLLSATPQETGPKRQKVPFDAVVFTERKPSTGDALIQSLGLSADGSNTIQDIASKNQGAARERLQLAEGGQVEGAALTSHCESCGVSPEDCLKKLGLHSDRERVLSPSPKSEKLWQLFQQIQAGLIRSPRIRKTSGSDPELDQEPGTHHPKVAPAKSKSLDTSPLHSPFDDIRKPMMNTV